MPFTLVAELAAIANEEADVPTCDEDRAKALRVLRQETAAKARSAKKRKAEEKELCEARAAQARIKMAALCVPGASGVLQTRSPNSTEHLESLMRLAVSARARGTGPGVDRVRRLQHRGAALLGSMALERQRHGLDLWVAARSREPLVFTVRGFSVLWDEASQRARTLLQSKPPPGTIVCKGQNVVEVLVVLGSVFEMRVRENRGQRVASIEQQPWLCPPLFISGTDAETLTAGLSQVLPVDPRDKDSMGKWCSHVDVVLMVMMFDGASGNIKAVIQMQRLMELGPKNAVLHPERCLTHILCIVKNGAVELRGLQGILYCVSKLMLLSKITSAIRETLIRIVTANFATVDDAEPDNGHLWQAILGMFQMDSEIDDLNESNSVVDGSWKWLLSVRQMVRRSRFHAETGKWVYYLKTRSGSRRPKITQEAMISYVVEPLCEVFLGRRWQIAAVSRWTGVLQVAQRVSVGIVMNSILPTVFSQLHDATDITEAQVQAEIQRNAAKALRGEEVTRVHL